MTISAEEFIVYLSLLSDELKLKVKISQEVKGGLITGTSATLGGFCGGPVGMLVGGVFGGTIAAVSCKDRQENVKDILVSLDRTKRLDLQNSFISFLEDDFENLSFSQFCRKLDENYELKYKVEKHFKFYLQEKLHLKVWNANLID